MAEREPVRTVGGVVSLGYGMGGAEKKPTVDEPSPALRQRLEHLCAFLLEFEVEVPTSADGSDESLCNEMDVTIKSVSLQHRKLLSVRLTYRLAMRFTRNHNDLSILRRMNRSDPVTSDDPSAPTRVASHPSSPSSEEPNGTIAWTHSLAFFS